MRVWSGAKLEGYYNSIEEAVEAAEKDKKEKKPKISGTDNDKNKKSRSQPQQQKTQQQAMQGNTSASQSTNTSDTISPDQAEFLASHGVPFIEVVEQGYQPALEQSQKRQHAFSQSTIGGSSVAKEEQHEALKQAFTGGSYTKKEKKLSEEIAKKTEAAEKKDAFLRVQEAEQRYKTEAKKIYNIAEGQKLANKAYNYIYSTLRQVNYPDAKAWASRVRSEILNIVVSNITRLNRAMTEIQQLYSNLSSHIHRGVAAEFKKKAEDIARKYGVAGQSEIKKLINSLAQSLAEAEKNKEQKEQKKLEEKANTIYINMITDYVELASQAKTKSEVNKIADKAYKDILQALLQAGIPRNIAEKYARKAKKEVIDTASSMVSKHQKAVEEIKKLYQDYLDKAKNSLDASLADKFSKEAHRIALKYGVDGDTDIQSMINNMVNNIEQTVEKNIQESKKQDEATASLVRREAQEEDKIAPELEKKLKEITATMENEYRIEATKAAKGDLEAAKRFLDNMKYYCSRDDDSKIVCRKIMNEIQRLAQVLEDMAKKAVLAEAKKLYSKYKKQYEGYIVTLKALSHIPPKSLRSHKSDILSIIAALRFSQPDAFTKKLPPGASKLPEVQKMLAELRDLYNKALNLANSLAEKAGMTLSQDRIKLLNELSDVANMLYQAGAMVVALADSYHLSKETWDALISEYNSLRKKIEGFSNTLKHMNEKAVHDSMSMLENTLSKLRQDVATFYMKVSTLYMQAGSPDKGRLQSITRDLAAGSDPFAVLDPGARGKLFAANFTPGYLIYKANEMITENKSIPDWLKPALRVAAAAGVTITYLMSGPVGELLTAYDVVRNVANVIRDPAIQSSINYMLNEIKKTCSSGDYKKCLASAEPLLEAAATAIIAHYSGDIMDTATRSAIERLSSMLRKVGRSDLAEKLEQILSKSSEQEETITLGNIVKKPEIVRIKVTDTGDGLLVEYYSTGTAEINNLVKTVKIPLNLEDELTLLLGDRTTVVRVIRQAAEQGKLQKLLSIIQEIERAKAQVPVKILAARLRAGLIDLDLDQVEQTLRDIFRAARATEKAQLSTIDSDVENVLTSKSVSNVSADETGIKFDIEGTPGKISVHVANQGDYYTAILSIGGKDIHIRYRVSDGRVIIDLVDGVDGVNGLKELLGDEYEKLLTLLKEAADKESSPVSTVSGGIAAGNRRLVTIQVEVDGHTIPLKVTISNNEGVVTVVNPKEFINELMKLGYSEEEASKIFREVMAKVKESPYEGILKVNVGSKDITVTYEGTESSPFQPGTYTSTVTVNGRRIGIVYTIFKDKNGQYRVGDVTLVGITEEEFEKIFGAPPKQWLENMINIAKGNITELEKLVNQYLRLYGRELEGAASTTIMGDGTTYTVSTSPEHTAEQATIYSGGKYVTVGRMTIKVEDDAVREALAKALQSVNDRIGELWEQAGGDPSKFKQLFENAVFSTMGGVPATGRYQYVLSTVVRQIVGALASGENVVLSVESSGDSLIVSVLAAAASATAVLRDRAKSGAGNTLSGYKSVYIIKTVTKPVYREVYIGGEGGSDKGLTVVDAWHTVNKEVYASIEEDEKLRPLFLYMPKTMTTAASSVVDTALARWLRHYVFNTIDERVTLNPIYIKRGNIVPVYDTEEVQVVVPTRRRRTTLINENEDVVLKPIYISGKPRIITLDKRLEESAPTTIDVEQDAIGVQEGDVIEIQRPRYVTIYVPLEQAKTKPQSQDELPQPHMNGTTPQLTGPAFMPSGGPVATSLPQIHVVKRVGERVVI